MLSSLVDPFAEAVRATVQPCTFLLIVPTLAAVVAAGARWSALVGSAVAAVVGGWLLAQNEFLLDGVALRLSGLAAVALLALLASPLLRQRTLRLGAALDRKAARAGAVGLLTLLATMWWRPCVGEELGGILNGAQDGLVGELAPMAAYMFGALVPVAVVVAARHTVEPARRIAVPIGWAFAIVGIVVGASLAAGQHDDVVVTLTRWTLE